MIVIDVGCAARPRQGSPGVEASVFRLIERFHPRTLYGFDPGVTKTAILENKTRVLLEPKAAWIYDGTIGWVEDGILAHAVPETDSSAVVECFDLASFIVDLDDGRLILKLDIEGGEYTILPYLHETGVDALLELLLVEWHGEPLDLPWRCEVQLWA